MNYQVAQEYPESKNNTITLKTVLVDRVAKGSLQGDWIVVLNDEVVSSLKVTDMASLDKVKSLFNTLCETYQLTGICNSTRDIQKF